MSRKLIKTIVTIGAAGILATACSPAAEEPGDQTPSAEATASPAEPTEQGQHGEEEAGEVEVASLPARVLIAYEEGGLLTLDAKTGEVLSDDAKEGFLRLAGAGDGRHAMVINGDKFEAYDLGLITTPHGDHEHYYTADPRPTDVEFDAPKAGHVVTHDGLTALFSDGDGTIQIYESSETGAPSNVRTINTGEAHHGVAVPFADGSVVHTVGNEDERFTIRHIDEAGETLAETTDYRNVHGEAAAADGRLVFGCEDGPVIFDGKEFTKVDVSSYAGEGGYQRSGNLAGSEESEWVLGDNKTEEDAEFERPTSVAFINSATAEAKEIKLGSSYWFRSLARGPQGEGLVLTYDGNLNVIDPESGEVTKKIKAIEPWEEKEKWQLPGPILKSDNGYAYVTDAENKELVVIDLLSDAEPVRHKLDVTPVEMTVE